MSETQQPPRRSVWRLALAAVVLVVVGWILVTTWGAVAAGHPAYLVTLLAVAGIAVLAAVRPVRRRSSRRTGVRLLVRVLQLLAVVGLLAVLGWLRPLPASQVAVDAMRSDGRVTVSDSATRIQLRPVASPRPTGLVFHPGARVDPRAYVPLLRPLAEAGYPVTVVKEPYGIAFLAPNSAGDVIAADPDVTGWMVAGHSLGGVVAADYAGGHGDTVDGLLLWASYPRSGADLAAAAGLQATSVWGTRDGLTTPADIEASRPALPPGTRFVPVVGAVHAFFGDYGEQPGDGTPTVPRVQAQAEIVAASLAAMETLAR